MRILVDTNVFLEVFLDQTKREEAQAFLTSAEGHDLFMSDYALHSIGLILWRRQRSSVFQRFVQDLILDGSAPSLRLRRKTCWRTVVENAVEFQLDFDDGYQYVAATKFDLRIVGYDSDFDRIPGGRLLPGDVFEYYVCSRWLPDRQPSSRQSQRPG